MSDDEPSIAELQRLEGEMTAGPYRYDHQGWIETMDRSINHAGAETEVFTLGARNAHEDGEGIVALRNAVPVLLEIAAAALAWQRAECETQSPDTDDYTVADMNGECAGDTHHESCPVAQSIQAMLAALAKVRP